ncbi:hypothetical protein [Microbacterium sp. H83]|uniref:hypothetical protein n=1 Tax=Microbacterium sp. H83 TaxID=1827324 RepID=UPI0007F35DFC|nr:hypothetical protein [Microbacterium sp. H83]OAN37333.1 hypothetical protein A4X16_16775 [Microbacterium sp. H83]
MSASDPHMLGPGLLPTPFTADEIRDATGRGTTIRLRVDRPDGTHAFRVNRFSETDAEGATLERWDADSPGDVTSGRVTWVELQRHAAFEVGTTSVSPERLTLDLGEVDCLRYDTIDSTFWFSLGHPGQPVRWESGGFRTTVTAIEKD